MLPTLNALQIAYMEIIRGNSFSNKYKTVLDFANISILINFR